MVASLQCACVVGVPRLKAIQRCGTGDGALGALLRGGELLARKTAEATNTRRTSRLAIP